MYIMDMKLKPLLEKIQVYRFIYGHMFEELRYKSFHRKPLNHYLQT